jgi:hypothetical protein
VKGKYIDANDKAYDQVQILTDAQTDLLQAIQTTRASNEVLLGDREKLQNIDEKVKRKIISY